MTLIVTHEDHVLRLTMNRPAERNSLNADLCSALVDAFEQAEEDPATRAILLEAKGEFFCAGMDMGEATKPEGAGNSFVRGRLVTAGLRLRKPLVAAVQGHAFSSGVGLIAIAHVAVAAQGVSFGLTDIRAGIWPYSAFHAVSRVLGHRRAVELSLTGRVFSTAEALQWGLVHYQTPALELEDRAMQLARGLAVSSPFAIRDGLDLAATLSTLSDAEAYDLSMRRRSVAVTTADFHEGVAALSERRRPSWPSPDPSKMTRTM